MKAIAKLNQLHFELVIHSSYSPNLAPSVYYLFQNLKRLQQRKGFKWNEEVIFETEANFADLNTSHYKHGIEMLEQRMKCIALEGN